jgi:hypothetical protein
MEMFESEIQELVYGVLTGDGELLAYLGADEIDGRIHLSLNDLEVGKIGRDKPAYIIIETLPAPPPARLGSGIDDWTERYHLHVFTDPVNRDARASIEGRLRELLHRKSFLTAHFIVYHVREDGREDVLAESGLLDHRYTVSFQFLPKGH